jgi:ceramide glucosyltransferase
MPNRSSAGSEGRNDLIILQYPSDVLFVAGIAGIAYLVLAAVGVRRFAALPPGRPAETPAVTILKPVCGLDAELYDNLVSFCRQDYGGPVQIVIGAHRESDPAVAVARAVKAALPEADIALVIDGSLPGTNFKVCNLFNMMGVAKHDVLVLADSDMRAEPHYLSTLVASLQAPGVGLVTCLYKGRPYGGIASRLGCGFINYGFLPSVLVSRLLDVDAGCFGATIALTRDTLARIGGFAGLLNHLADDYMIGEKVRQLGLRVAIAPYLVECVVEEPGFAALLRHELRWQRTIRLLQPAGHAASAITNPVAISLLSLAFSPFAPHAWLLVAASLAARLGLIYTCNRSFRLVPMSLPLIPVRDILSMGLLIASFLGQKVTWRDRQFQVGETGEMTLKGDPLV